MRRGQAALLLAATAVAALVLGAAISVAAFYVARYGPSADSWSFKGNGAIAVYTALPAVLAGGWTALVLHARGSGWLAGGIGAGFVGLLLALLGAGLLPLLGAGADRLGSPLAFIALLAWMAVGPIWAGRVRARRPAAVGLHVAAGALWLLAAIAGLVVAGILLPAGS